MGARVRWVAAGLGVALGASAADAQPVFRYEQVWTAQVGGRLFGFRDVVQNPGGLRWTQVWVGGRAFEPVDRRVWALVPPVGLVVGAREVLRRLRP